MRSDVIRSDSWNDPNPKGTDAYFASRTLKQKEPSISDERHQGDITSPFDRQCHLALMGRTVAGNPPGNDLAPFGDECSENLDVFVIDILNVILTESAHFAFFESTCFLFSEFWFGHFYSFLTMNRAQQKWGGLRPPVGGSLNNRVSGRFQEEIIPRPRESRRRICNLSSSRHCSGSYVLQKWYFHASR